MGAGKRIPKAAFKPRSRPTTRSSAREEAIKQGELESGDGGSSLGGVGNDPQQVPKSTEMDEPENEGEAPSHEVEAQLTVAEYLNSLQAVDRKGKRRADPPHIVLSPAEDVAAEVGCSAAKEVKGSNAKIGMFSGQGTAIAAQAETPLPSLNTAGRSLLSRMSAPVPNMNAPALPPTQLVQPDALAPAFSQTTMEASLSATITVAPQQVSFFPPASVAVAPPQAQETPNYFAHRNSSLFPQQATTGLSSAFFPNVAPPTTPSLFGLPQPNAIQNFATPLLPTAPLMRPSRSPIVAPPDRGFSLDLRELTSVLASSPSFMEFAAQRQKIEAQSLVPNPPTSSHVASPVLEVVITPPEEATPSLGSSPEKEELQPAHKCTIRRQSRWQSRYPPVEETYRPLKRILALKRVADNPPPRCFKPPSRTNSSSSSTLSSAESVEAVHPRGWRLWQRTRPPVRRLRDGVDTPPEIVVERIPSLVDPRPSVWGDIPPPKTGLPPLLPPLNLEEPIDSFAYINLQHNAVLFPDQCRSTTRAPIPLAGPLYPPLPTASIFHQPVFQPTWVLPPLSPPPAIPQVYPSLPQVLEPEPCQRWSIWSLRKPNWDVDYKVESKRVVEVFSAGCRWMFSCLTVCCLAISISMGNLLRYAQKVMKEVITTVQRIPSAINAIKPPKKHNTDEDRARAIEPPVVQIPAATIRHSAPEPTVLDIPPPLSPPMRESARVRERAPSPESVARRTRQMAPPPETPAYERHVTFDSVAVATHRPQVVPTRKSPLPSLAPEPEPAPVPAPRRNTRRPLYLHPGRRMTVKAKVVEKKRTSLMSWVRLYCWAGKHDWMFALLWTTYVVWKNYEVLNSPLNSLSLSVWLTLLLCAVRTLRERLRSWRPKNPPGIPWPILLCLDLVALGWVVRLAREIFPAKVRVIESDSEEGDLFLLAQRMGQNTLAEQAQREAEARAAAEKAQQERDRFRDAQRSPVQFSNFREQYQKEREFTRVRAEGERAARDKAIREWEAHRAPKETPAEARAALLRETYERHARDRATRAERGRSRPAPRNFWDLKTAHLPRAAPTVVPTRRETNGPFMAAGTKSVMNGRDHRRANRPSSLFGTKSSFNHW